MGLAPVGTSILSGPEAPADGGGSFGFSSVNGGGGGACSCRALCPHTVDKAQATRRTKRKRRRYGSFSASISARRDCGAGELGPTSFKCFCADFPESPQILKASLL